MVRFSKICLMFLLATSCGKLENKRNEVAVSNILNEKEKEESVSDFVDVAIVFDYEEAALSLLSSSIPHRIVISECSSFREGQTLTYYSESSHVGEKTMRLHRGDTGCQASLAEFFYEGPRYIPVENASFDQHIIQYGSDDSSVTNSFWVSNDSQLNQIGADDVFIKFSITKSLRKNPLKRSLVVENEVFSASVAVEDLDLPAFYVNNMSEKYDSILESYVLEFNLHCSAEGPMCNLGNLEFLLFLNNENKAEFSFYEIYEQVMHQSSYTTDPSYSLTGMSFGMPESSVFVSATPEVWQHPDVEECLVLGATLGSPYEPSSKGSSSCEAQGDYTPAVAAVNSPTGSFLPAIPETWENLDGNGECVVEGASSGSPYIPSQRGSSENCDLLGEYVPSKQAAGKFGNMIVDFQISPGFLAAEGATELVLVVVHDLHGGESDYYSRSYRYHLIRYSH